jgi:hypothetical protein
MNGLDWKYYRTQQDMPLEIFYDYFKEHKPDSKITLEQFKMKFPEYIQKFSRMPYPNSEGRPVRAHLPTIIHKIYEYYDRKYGYTGEDTAGG